MTISFIGNAAKNPDNVLEQAKGQYECLFIVGYNQEGELDARSSTNLSRERILWLIEQFKNDLLFRMENNE